MRNNRNKKEQEVFFSKISDQYSKRSSAYLESSEYFRRLSSRYIKGIVLDIGNGGVISFDLDRAKKVVAADISIDMLKHLKRACKGRYQPIKSNKIKCIKADVRKMPFQKDYFDVVIMLTTAHHLSESSLVKTRQNLYNAFSEISRVLKPKGTFLMVEVHLFKPLKILQDLFFEIAFHFFMLFHKPLPYFLSRKEIKRYLNGMGLAQNKEILIPSGKKVYMPFFPSLSFPKWIYDRLLSSVLYVSCKINKS